jgi:hypothetical protein
MDVQFNRYRSNLYYGKVGKYIGVIPKSKDLSYYSIIFIPPSSIKPMIV